MFSKLISVTVALLALANAQEYSTPKGKGKINAIPILGLGTFGLGGFSVGNTNHPNILNGTRDAVKRALSKGFRHIDAATIYGNEKGVGMGLTATLKEGKLNREDFWVTTKLWSADHGDPEAALKTSLKNLGLSYVDLYLMHFPFGLGKGPSPFDHVETWKRMQKLVRPDGPVRFIGVSNFSPDQMTDLMKLPGIKPKVHQFEMHPYLQQTKFVNWHKENNIAMTAYAPLANTSPSYKNNYNHSIPLILNNTVLTDIKKARGCASEVQVTLAWNIHRKVAVIPKATKGEHQDENLEVEKCVLTSEDMDKIEKFTTEKKWVARMNNPCKQFGIPCYNGLEVANGGAWRTGS